MSEFEKRTIDLIGGLKVSVDSEEEEAEFIDSLREVTKKNGPWTTRFLYAWAEAFGAEIKGENFGMLVKAEFIPRMTLGDVRQRNLASLKRVFNNESLIEGEMELRMSRYVETSEGVIWIGW